MQPPAVRNNCSGTAIHKVVGHGRKPGVAKRAYGMKNRKECPVKTGRQTLPGAKQENEQCTDTLNGQRKQARPE
jgi:hypothetical protein